VGNDTGGSVGTSQCNAGLMGAITLGNTEFAPQQSGVKRGTVKGASFHFKRWDSPSSPVDAHDERSSLDDILDVNLLKFQAVPLQKLLGAPAVRTPVGCVHPNFSFHDFFSPLHARLDMSRSHQCSRFRFSRPESFSNQHWEMNGAQDNSDDQDCA
jgi:hypothetical protein